MTRTFILNLLALGLMAAAPARAADIWVAPTGSDRNVGTADKPLATVAAALRKVRDLRRLHDPAVETGAHIWVRGGEYRLSEPLFLRPEDAGTATSPTVIEAAPGEQPVRTSGCAVESTAYPSPFSCGRKMPAPPPAPP